MENGFEYMGILAQQLRNYFGHQKEFTKQELQDFYQREKDYSESDLFWDVYDLKRKNVIKSVDQNTYKLVDDDLRSFEPILSDKLVEINELLHNFQLDSNYCIWSSEWLNDLMTHQVMRTFILVEVERDAAEFLFNYLRDHLNRDVFLYLNKKADKVLLDRYVFEAKNPVVVTNIITKSPVKKVKEDEGVIYIPKLEKILVDLFYDDDLFIAYKGAEQERIFENAINRYRINFETMFSYAKRRKRDKHIKKYLYEHFKCELINILE